MFYDFLNINICIYYKFFKFVYFELYVYIRIFYGICIENMEKEKELVVLFLDCIR